MDAAQHGTRTALKKQLTKVNDMSEDLNHLINKNAKGRRPQFLNTKAEEHLMSMTMALMQELAVTRERLDTLERLVAKKGVLDLPEIEAYRPDAEAEAERQTAQQKLIATVMRSMEQEIHALNEQDTPEVNQLQAVNDDRAA